MSSHDQPANGPAPMEPYEEWTARQADPTDRDAEPQAKEDDAGAGRRTAMVTAAAHALPWGVVMWVSAASAAGTARAHYAAGWAYTSAPPTPPPYLAWLLAIGGTCWTVCTAAELRYAHRAAGAYPPRGPWARLPASPALRILRWLPVRLDRRLGSGGGCLGLLGVAVLGPVVVLAWSTVSAAAGPLWVLAVGTATLVHLTTAI